MKTVYLPTIKDVKAGVAWTPAEKKLQAACKTGDLAFAGAGLPENTDDPTRCVRASLIRYLMLGGCEGHTESLRPHPKGVRLVGAWIGGELDLGGCHSRLDLGLDECLFEDVINLQDAEIGGLNLQGSRAREMVDLHRLQTETSVMLRNGFEAEKGVDLGGARIGGDLDCTGGRFRNEGGDAINAAAANIGENVFLRGETFLAEGMVDLGGAQIGGQLACTGGTFRNEGGKAINADSANIGADVFLRDVKVTGNVDFVGAAVVWDMRCERAAFNGTVDFEAAQIGAGLFWQGISGHVPTVDLTDTQVGNLRDDRESWEVVKEVKLGGFRYDRLEKPISFGVRRAWLAKHSSDAIPRTNLGKGWIKSDPDDFDPQPYSQLAKVLRADGHRKMAGRVLELREDHTARVERDRVLARGDGQSVGPMPKVARAWVSYWLTKLFKGLFGYGHAPGRVFYFLGGLMAFTTAFYSQVYAAGQMAPNSDVILTSADWLRAVSAQCVDPAFTSVCAPPLRVWEATSNAYPDYETFSPFLYALDLFVPLDALGQENAWAPSKDRGDWGWWGYYLRMPIQMAGWIITAMGAAVVTGLVGRKD